MVKFPDFPEILTDGNDFNEAMFMAKDIFYITIEYYCKEKRNLPLPSTFEQAKKYILNDVNSLIKAKEDILIQFFEAPNINTKCVKVTLSLLQCELDRIDAKAKKYGMSRSELLVQAAECYGIQDDEE